MDACPALDALIGFADGALNEPSRTRLESHLLGCEPCRSAVSAALDPEASDAAGQRVSRRPAPLRGGRLAWASAAGFLLILGAAWGWRTFSRQGPSPVPVVESRMPGPARRVAGLSDRLNPSETAELPDGTRVAAGASVSARFVPPRDGERYRLAVEQGDVDVATSKGGGALSVDTPCGEIRVLGTRFTARVARFAFDGKPAAAAAVEVREGTIALVNAHGMRKLQAGHRGVLIEGREPIGQIQMEDRSGGSAWEIVEQLGGISMEGEK